MMVGAWPVEGEWMAITQSLAHRRRFPQEAFSPLFAAVTCRCHASAAQSRASVLPVPVGDSNSAFSPLCKALRRLCMNSCWTPYASTGKSTLNVCVTVGRSDACTSTA
jgi:hypothetical protein